MNTITLRNGMDIPQIGLGTWQLNDKEIIREIIKYAIDVGYRLIDTAAAYSNEINISKTLRETGIPRSTLILSDKVWNSSRGFEAVQDACRKSLKKMKTDYFDLYLVHWPASIKLHPDWAEINASTWRGMEQLYKDGLARAIGVCNFKLHHLEELEKTAEIMPFVNQVELHPGMPQLGLMQYCCEKNIQIVASSPLGNGQILNNYDLIRIANSKGKTVSQICLRYGIQKKLVLIPKTSKVNRLNENINVFDFELTDEEMTDIDNIEYCGGIGIDSDEVIDFG